MPTVSGGLSDDTEALTRQGWRGGLALKVDDEVATFDCTRNTYKFDRVSSVSVRPYDGPLVHLEGRGLDCRLTPGHPILLKTHWREEEGDRWRYEQAGDLPRNFQIPAVGALRGNGLPALSNDLLQVIGWVIAGGSYHSRGANPILGVQRSTVVKKRGQGLVDKIDRCLAHFKGVGRYERRARPTVNYYLGRSLSNQVLEFLKTTCVSFCRKTIDRWERNGKFPKRIRLGATAVAWVESEIDQWFAGLIALRKWSRPGSNGQPAASKADALSS